MRRHAWSRLLGFASLCGLLLAAASGQATSYYVDAAGGDDAASGISQQEAFKTIARAVALLQPGDTCLVLAGTYDERVQLHLSGELGRPITLQAQGVAVTQGFVVDEADHIRILGFEVTQTRYPGISVDGSHCEVRGNYIHDVGNYGISLRDQEAPFTASAGVKSCVVADNRIAYAGNAGIFVAGQDNLVENNEISHTLQYPPILAGERPVGADADGLRFFGQGHVIRGNSIRDILHSDAGNENPHSDCFQTWAVAKDILFEGNFCDMPQTSNSAQIVMAEGDQMDGLTFRNNVFVMHDPGYSPMNFTGAPGRARNLRIVHNTFIHPGSLGEYAIWLRDVDNAVVKNNLIYNYGRANQPYVEESGCTGLEISHNAYFTTGAAPSNGPFPHDIWMQELGMVDLAAGNYRLLSSSPLINAGEALADVTADFDGILRPQGAGYDIGAFEYQDPAVQPDAGASPPDLGNAHEGGQADSGGGAHDASSDRVMADGDTNREGAPSPRNLDGGCGCVFAQRAPAAPGLWVLLTLACLLSRSRVVACLGRRRRSMGVDSEIRVDTLIRLRHRLGRPPLSQPPQPHL